MRVVSAEEMRLIEATAYEKYHLDERIIIENVGLQTANYLYREFFKEEHPGEVVVLVGKGNNGADGLAMARHLVNKGIHVRAFLLFAQEDCSEELMHQCKMAKSFGVRVSEVLDTEALESYFTQTQSKFFVVDAILGTGARLPLSNHLFDIVKVINRFSSFTVAIDLATGIEGDTGLVGGNCIEADLTLAIGLPKLGHFVSYGPHHSGKLHVIDAGFPVDVLTGGDHHLLVPQDIREFYVLRNKFESKSAFGHTLVIGGSEGMTGALVLSSLAALKVGAGLVTAMTWEKNFSELAGRVPPEIMTRKLRKTMVGDKERYIDSFDRFNSVVIGPGLGKTEAAREVVVEILSYFPGPVVIDADAINVLKLTEDVSLFLNRKFPVIMTPHMGEFSRFTDVDLDQLKEYPFSNLKLLVDKINCAILLKGASSYLGIPDGRVYINYLPNDGMATGGSGDVLAGILGGLLTQVVREISNRPGIFQDRQVLYDQFCLGLIVHTLAGKHAVKELGQRSMTAGSIIKFLPEAFSEIDDIMKGSK